MVAKLLRTIARLMRNFITNVVKIPGICKNLPKIVQMNPGTDISCGKRLPERGCRQRLPEENQLFFTFFIQLFFCKRKNLYLCAPVKYGKRITTS